MKNILIISLVIALFIISSCENSTEKKLLQDNIWENVDTLKVDIDSVIDFTADGVYFYFLTTSQIIKADGFGKIISKENHDDLTGICWDENEKALHKITSNLIIITSTGDSIKIDTKQLLSKKNSQTKFLAHSDSIFYTCYYPSSFEVGSFSNQVIKVPATNIAERFSYFVGNPTSIYYQNNILYYISNTGSGDNNYTNPPRKALIIKYDCDSGIIIEKKPDNYAFLPIFSPMGLYIDSNNTYYFYSIYEKSIIKYKE